MHEDLVKEERDGTFQSDCVCELWIQHPFKILDV